METNATYPAERTILRPFILPDDRGDMVDLGTFRQHRNLVLLFLNKTLYSAESLLRDLGKELATLVAEEAVALAVLHGDQKDSSRLKERLQLPFSVLSDPKGEVVSSFAGGGTAIYITDRFREIFAHRHDDKLFTRDEVLEWLAHINRQCPE